MHPRGLSTRPVTREPDLLLATQLRGDVHLPETHVESLDRPSQHDRQKHPPQPPSKISTHHSASINYLAGTGHFKCRCRNS